MSHNLFITYFKSDNDEQHKQIRSVRLDAPLAKYHFFMKLPSSIAGKKNVIW